PRRRLNVLLQLAQLLDVELALDVALDLVHVPLQPAEQVTERARGLRQLLGAEHHERHYGDDDDFGEADVEHCVRGQRVQVRGAGPPGPRAARFEASLTTSS